MKKNILYAACGAALLLSACASGRKVNGCRYPVVKGNAVVSFGGEAAKGDENPDPGYLILSDSQREMVKAGNRMALDVFRQLGGLDSKVISPLSIYYLMGMLANGADGTTRQEIMHLLGCDKMTVADVNDLCHLLICQAGTLDKATELQTANYVAVNRQNKLKQPFVNSLCASYDASVENLDFTSSKTVKHINQWCSDHTDGMVPGILDSVEPSAVAYVMNALYFNGSWTDKFDKGETKEENFRGYTRNVRKVQMMHREGKYPYCSASDFQAVELPYGNGTYTMTVLLPAEGKSLDDMVQHLTADTLAALGDRMTEYTVDLKLPRFTSEMELTLNDIITRLGAPSLFSAATANFSNFADGSVYISKLLQKSKIEVSEEGTKAAAVTAAVMTMACLEPEEPRRVEFHADRPFVYVISEKQSGAVYFIGRFTAQ